MRLRSLSSTPYYWIDSEYEHKYYANMNALEDTHLKTVMMIADQYAQESLL